MKRLSVSFALAPLLAGILSMASSGCLSSNNPSGPGSSSNADGGSLVPDSGAGCNAQILSRCVYPSGVCFEYSGPPVGDAGDPFDCVSSGGTLNDDGQGCVRTGTEGSCVGGAGIAVINGGPCTYYLTTWLPGGYDSGAPGEPCRGNPGTFVPN